MSNEEAEELFVHDGERITGGGSSTSSSSRQVSHFRDFLLAVKECNNEAEADVQLGGWSMRVSRKGRNITREFTPPPPNASSSTTDVERYSCKEAYLAKHQQMDEEDSSSARPKRQKRPPTVSACTLAPSLAAPAPPPPSLRALLSKSSRILVLLGAGVSTSAGLADFRSKLTGLYAQQLEDDNCAPEVLFDNKLFELDPLPFYKFAGRTFLPQIAAARPTAMHQFVLELERQGRLQRCYTQNVDGLELLVGLRQESVVQVHGTLRSATCMECQWQTSAPEWWHTPDCQRCDEGYLKPDMTFFGQRVELPPTMEQDCLACDAVLVVGTSLSVLPVSQFLQLIPKKTAKHRVWLNRAPPPLKASKFFNHVRLGECDDEVVTMVKREEEEE